MGLTQRIREIFEPSVMLPAAGQGALGIEVRTDRRDVIDALAPLVHHTTWLAIAAERAVSRAMGGSCSMPLAAFATLTQDRLMIEAAWGDTEQKLPLVRARQESVVTDLVSAAALGQQVADELRAAVLAQGGSLPHLVVAGEAGR